MSEAEGLLKLLQRPSAKLPPLIWIWGGEATGKTSLLERIIDINNEKTIFFDRFDYLGGVAALLRKLWLGLGFSNNTNVPESLIDFVAALQTLKASLNERIIIVKMSKSNP